MGMNAMEWEGTFRRSAGSQEGSLELLSRPCPPQPVPESQSRARGKALGASGTPAPPFRSRTLPPRAQHLQRERGAEDPQGPREPKGWQFTDARRRVKSKK